MHELGTSVADAVHLDAVEDLAVAHLAVVRPHFGADVAVPCDLVLDIADDGRWSLQAGSTGRRG